MNIPHQRIGSISNAHVGSDFESVAIEYFRTIDVELQPSFSLEIGLENKKNHRFDLGSHEPKVIVECKSHRWTSGGKVPSAKMSVWNEAMFYFLLAPRKFRKIMFVLHDRRERTDESLLQYYLRTHHHLIPDEVEFLEFDADFGSIVFSQQGPTSR